MWNKVRLQEKRNDTVQKENEQEKKKAPYVQVLFIHFRTVVQNDTS